MFLWDKKRNLNCTSGSMSRVSDVLGGCSSSFPPPCLRQMAEAAAHPEPGLRRQEDPERRPHRPGLPPDAQEYLPHYGSQEVSIYLCSLSHTHTIDLHQFGLWVSFSLSLSSVFIYLFVWLIFESQVEQWLIPVTIPVTSDFQTLTWTGDTWCISSDMNVMHV